MIFCLNESCFSKPVCLRLLEFLRLAASVVIVGTNDAFMAGGNRASFLSHMEDENCDEETDDSDLFSNVVTAIQNHPHTVVCAIDGAHVTGGAALEFLMACDYRVANEWTEFSVETNSSSSTPNIFSPMERLLSGQVISALEAHTIGLIDELVVHPEKRSIEELATILSLTNPKRKKNINSKNCLLHYLPDEYLKFRTAQVFNLIRDFPDGSTFAVDELREAISITHQGGFVIEAIAKQLEDRLLIPGAHTEDVLSMYLRTHQVVEVLFGRTEVFTTIAHSIIAHLHKRSDAVKCIVSAILENDENCSPNVEKPKDTMSLLIGVYGGKDDFLLEYREMLASRLLTLVSFEVDRELASLELMRSKFGQPELLTQCAVMVQDVLESKKLQAMMRVPTHLLSTLVVTKHSWPARPSWDNTDILTFLPESVLAGMKAFELAFSKIKPTQKIQWIKQEGVVVLELERAGTVLEFKVSPIHVQVLFLFQQKTALNIENISAGIGESMETTKSVVQFWAAKGILREIEINKFVLDN